MREEVLREALTAIHQLIETTDLNDEAAMVETLDLIRECAEDEVGLYRAAAGGQITLHAPQPDVSAPVPS